MQSIFNNLVPIFTIEFGVAELMKKALNRDPSFLRALFQGKSNYPRPQTGAFGPFSSDAALFTITRQQQSGYKNCF